MMRRVLDSRTLVGVKIGLYPAYPNETFLLLNEVEHGLNWCKKMRVDHPAVVHKRMSEHELPFGSNDPVIVVPGYFFRQEELLDGLKVSSRQEVFINCGHVAKPAQIIWIRQ